ncbi:MAG TPA: Wzz/FepE/Etk N-terminal domain-containing protein [Bryobacteraceae bacterium]|jgi:polysaccharide chain length determinant protein (PEP-CTERM system associated)
MQPNENYTISRRALDVEDYIDILRRHKGWIFGPFLFTLVVSVVGAYTWPDTYISKGIIKVEPQQVPENLVQSAGTHDMGDRINSMLEAIESRSTLTEIITSNSLYLKERSRLPLDDVIDEMKKKIQIDMMGQTTNRQVPAFTVSFSYPDRHQAQKVVTDLIGRFLSANTQAQSNQTYQTTAFMKDEADTAQKELDAIESRLAAYKMENNGRLPEQTAENYQKMTALETMQTNLESQINRYQNEKLTYVANLNIFKTQADAMEKIKPETGTVAAQQQQKSVKLQKAEAEVEALTNQLQQLRQHFQESYPDVKNAKASLESAESKRDKIIADEKAEADAKKDVVTGKPPVAPAVIKEAADRDATIARYNAQIAQDDTQIEQLTAQMKNVSREIQVLNGRIDSVPQSEKEYEDLKRERDIKNQEYEDMKKNLGKAQIQQEMENRQEGEKLEILDGANLPETAAYPNHPLVVAVGAGIGLMLGIVIAGAREMKDTSLKNLKDVRAYTQMAILGSIPLLENDFVVRRRRRLAWLGWTTACLTAVVLMSGSIVYYISTKQ